MRISEILKAVIADMNVASSNYALVGGVAVSSHVRPRSTKDVDLAVASSSDADSEALVRFFVGKGYQLVDVFEHTVSGTLSTVRLSLPSDPLHEPCFDLLFNSSGIEAEVVQSASLRTLMNTKVKIASKPALVALKTLSRDDTNRANDNDDLQELLRIISKKELAKAKEYLELITSRGFNRKRDLNALLEESLKLAKKSQKLRR